MTLGLALIVWLLPGLGAAALLEPGARRDPLRLAGLGCLLAAATSTLAAFALDLVGGSPRELSWMLLGLAVAGAAALVAARRRPLPSTDGLSRRELVAGGLSILALAVLGARQGATFRVTADALDHVATLREILVSGDFFPRETVHLDAGLAGADPRKGLLHGVYAALAALARRDPVEFWNGLPAAATPFVFLAGYGFLRATGVAARWAIAGGWLLVLTRSGGPGGDVATISPYPNQVGAGLFWLAAGASLRAVVAEHRGAAIVAGLGLWAAVATHVMYAPFAALLGVLLLASRAPWRRVGMIAAIAGIPALPYLFGRLAESVPVNPIHTELQGMLLFPPRWFVPDPGRLWPDVGWLGVFGYPLAMLFLVRRRPAELAARFLFWTPIALVLLVGNPLLVPWLHERVGYLLFRAFWFLPPALAVGFVLPRLAAGPARRKALAVLLVLVAVLPASRTAGSWWHPAARRDGAHDGRALGEPLAEVTRGLPPRSVVLADPVTSYLLPAFTTHKVVATFDQHASPNDTRAPERLRAVRDALLPATSPARAHDICRAWGASYVLLASTWPDGFRTRDWTFQRAAVLVREQTLRASEGFSVHREGPRLVLLDVRAERPADTDTLPPRGGVGATLARAELRPTAAAGRALEARVHWLPAAATDSTGSLTASLRLDAVDAPPGPWGKPGRKLVESLRGVSYRQRFDWGPGNGFTVPEVWTEAGAWDRIQVPLSSRLVPGRYAARIVVRRLPVLPNHTLRDYFSDEDVYAGDVVDTITVEPPRAR